MSFLYDIHSLTLAIPYNFFLTFLHPLICPSLHSVHTSFYFRSLPTVNVSIPFQPIHLPSYSASISPSPPSPHHSAATQPSLPPCSPASVIPHGPIIISKGDSGLLHRAALPWNNMWILNHAPHEQSTRGWLVHHERCNSKRKHNTDRPALEQRTMVPRSSLASSGGREMLLQGFS